MHTFRAADPRAPRRRDAVLALVLIALAVAEGMLRRDLLWPWATVGVTVVLLAGLPWRRRHPLVLVLAMAVITTGFAIAQAAAGVPQSGLAAMFPLLLVPYALFRWATRVERIVGSIALGAGVLTSAALATGSTTDRVIGAVVGLLLVGTACLIGALRRERAASLEREIAMARVQERTALARDLHDTVAHHVSAIAIRAQAATARGPHSAEVTESLAAIEQEASAALGEMRTIVRTLREPAEYAPARGLDDVAALATDGPPPVTVRIDVPPTLPQLVALTLYRVAQEAVTNARRHAVDARRIEVDVRTDDDDVVLSVIDDGRPSSATGDGYGLRGMTERVSLLGGRLDAGPGEDGGWTLRARIPRSAT
ncbi:histidine kinase [Microbacterium sp. NPDC056234]|uniref:sensor histidine kinase n=1 Tax=Microbacterium sp. NPDC056234 TaxID=3345757 RepID=UPI0035E0E89C